MVGTITTSAVRASDSARLPRLGVRGELLGVRVERLRGGEEQAGVGDDLAELLGPSPSRSTGVDCGWPSSSGSVPQSAPSVRLKRLPGCFRHGPVGSVRSNGTALSGSSAALEPASRITSYSESEGRRPGDDPLDALVVGVPFDPVFLHVLEQLGTGGVLPAIAAASNPAASARS